MNDSVLCAKPITVSGGDYPLAKFSWQQPQTTISEIRSGRPVIWPGLLGGCNRSRAQTAPPISRCRAFVAVELRCYATRSGKARMTAAVRLETPSRS